MRISDFDESGFNSKRPVYHPFDSTLDGFKLEINDIVMCMTGGTVGKSFFVDYMPEPMLVNQRVADIKINNFMCKKYVYFFILSPFVQQIINENKNSTNDNISVGLINSFLIPVPSFSEQLRIIERINQYDYLLTIYDKLEREKTKLDGEIYDKLKKSILQYAIQGKLVPQDPNDEPASVLLERIRAEKKAQLGKKYVESYIYKGDDNCYYEKIGSTIKNITDAVPFEIPSNWEWARWGEISKSIQYGYNAPAKEVGRIKMVRISDIQDNSIEWSSVPFCDIKEDELEHYLLEENDILFARTGGTVGKSFLMKQIKEPAIFAGYLIRTQYSNEISPEYLKFFMESPFYWVQLRSGTIATAQPNCNGKTLAEMLVPIPSQTEQIRIAVQLSEMFKMINGEI